MPVTYGYDGELKKRIVFGVDDNAANLSFLNQSLTAATYTFFGFSNGLGCLDALQRCKPLCILLDIQMPELDGFELCQRIRAIPGAERIPIAFLTGRKTREDVTRGLQVGAKDFLLKPINPQQLVERVEYLIRKATQEQVQSKKPGPMVW